MRYSRPSPRGPARRTSRPGPQPCPSRSASRTNCSPKARVRPGGEYPSGSSSGALSPRLRRGRAGTDRLVARATDAADVSLRDRLVERPRDPAGPPDARADQPLELPPVDRPAFLLQRAHDAVDLAVEHVLARTTRRVRAADHARRVEGRANPRPVAPRALRDAAPAGLPL